MFERFAEAAILPLYIWLISYMMREIKLFKTLNQLNQLLRKMIHCFTALEAPPAGQNAVNAMKTCIKTAFTLHYRLQTLCWKCNLLNKKNKSYNTNEYDVSV